jgi:4-amino-4-deoxychorismate lyase
MSFDDKFGNLFLSYLYELDAHLDRFLRSAAKAKITPPVDQAAMREILLQTVAAAHCRDGFLRYWLSCGRGGFELSTKECDQATFYAIVLDENHVNDKVDCGVKVLQPFIYLCAVVHGRKRM